MSNDEKNQAQQAAAVDDDDEPDEWEQRIDRTGCGEENAKMTDCYYEKKDWRLCAKEMETFRECWKTHNNNQRTMTKDV